MHSYFGQCVALQSPLICGIRMIGSSTCNSDWSNWAAQWPAILVILAEHPKKLIYFCVWRCYMPGTTGLSWPCSSPALPPSITICMLQREMQIFYSSGVCTFKKSNGETNCPGQSWSSTELCNSKALSSCRQNLKVCKQKGRSKRLCYLKALSSIMEVLKLCIQKGKVKGCKKWKGGDQVVRNIGSVGILTDATVGPKSLKSLKLNLPDYLCQWAPAECPGFLCFPCGPVRA